MPVGNSDRTPVINLDQVELRPLPPAMAAPGEAAERYALKSPRSGFSLALPSLATM